MVSWIERIQCNNFLRAGPSDNGHANAMFNIYEMQIIFLFATSDNLLGVLKLFWFQFNFVKQMIKQNHPSVCVSWYNAKSSNYFKTSLETSIKGGNLLNMDMEMMMTLKYLKVPRSCPSICCPNALCIIHIIPDNDQPHSVIQFELDKSEPSHAMLLLETIKL